jgi:hypothetical protein
MRKSYKTKIIELTETLKDVPKDSMKLWKNTQNSGTYTLLYEINGKRKRHSLFTKDKQQATRTVAELGCGIRYSDSEHATIIAVHEANLDRITRQRTWQQVFEDSIDGGMGANSIATANSAWTGKEIDKIRNMKVIKTTANDLLSVFKVLPKSKQSRLVTVYNHARDNNWLINNLVSPNQWRKYRKASKKDTAAITEEHHLALLGAVDKQLASYYKMRDVKNEFEWGGWANMDFERWEEMRSLLRLLWELGASQRDARELTTDKINFSQGRIIFQRKKWRKHGVLAEREPIRFPMSAECKRILKPLYKKAKATKSKYIFPKLSQLNTQGFCRVFTRLRERAGIPKRVPCIDGISKRLILHSYRYRFAQECVVSGATKREAQLMLGQNSSMVNAAYSREEELMVKPLDEIARERGDNIIRIPVAA